MEKIHTKIKIGITFIELFLFGALLTLLLIVWLDSMSQTHLSSSGWSAIGCCAGGYLFTSWAYSAYQEIDFLQLDAPIFKKAFFWLFACASWLFIAIAWVISGAILSPLYAIYWVGYFLGLGWRASENSEEI